MKGIGNTSRDPRPENGEGSRLVERLRQLEERRLTAAAQDPPPDLFLAALEYVLELLDENMEALDEEIALEEERAGRVHYARVWPPGAEPGRRSSVPPRSQ